MHAIVEHSFVRCTILILGENNAMSIGLPTIFKKIVVYFPQTMHILPSRFFLGHAKLVFQAGIPLLNAY